LVGGQRRFGEVILRAILNFAVEHPVELMTAGGVEI
jgi:hypothetical protein